MSNFTLILTFDWSTYGTPGFTGRFTSQEWSKDGGTPYPDFIAADLNVGDTMTVEIKSLTPNPNLTVNQLTVIFAKEAGAGNEPCTPFRWTNTDVEPNVTTLLGILVFTPGEDGSLASGSWLSSSCDDTYPPTPEGENLLTVATTAVSAFKSILCAEIWDNKDNKAFFTHDPEMDINP